MREDNQINYWGWVFRKNRIHERKSALESLVEMHDEGPKLLATPLLASFSEQVATWRKGNVVEGVRGFASSRR